MLPHQFQECVSCNSQVKPCLHEWDWKHSSRFSLESQVDPLNFMDWLQPSISIRSKTFNLLHVNTTRRNNMGGLTWTLNPLHVNRALLKLPTLPTDKHRMLHRSPETPKHDFSYNFTQYRPPSDAVFFESFYTMFEKAWLEHRNVMVIGDLNIDRRLVPYHGKCKRIQSRIEFIYIYIYIYIYLFIYMHQRPFCDGVGRLGTG